MPSFSTLLKGTRARKRVAFPVGAKAALDRSAAEPFEGETVPVDLRPLLPSEQLDVLERAKALCASKGNAEAGEGDPMFDFAVAVHTVAIATLDVDSPEDAPAPFFDGGAEQILTSELLTRDHVVYLYELQQSYQAEVSPLAHELTRDQVKACMQRTAAGDILPFFQLRPGLRWSFVRFMAETLVASPLFRSQLSSPSETTPLPS